MITDTGEALPTHNPREPLSSDAQSDATARDGLQHVEITDGTFYVDGTALGSLLNIDPADVPELMRTRAITSMCERGVGIHDGEFRLSFFYGNRRARLSVDTSGRILRRSTVDFGQRPIPAAMRKPGG